MQFLGHSCCNSDERSSCVCARRHNIHENNRSYGMTCCVGSVCKIEQYYCPKHMPTRLENRLNSIGENKGSTRTSPTERIRSVRYSLSDTLRRMIRVVPISPTKPQATKPVTKPKNWDIAPMLTGPNMSPISFNEPAVPRLVESFPDFARLLTNRVRVRPHNSNP